VVSVSERFTHWSDSTMKEDGMWFDTLSNTHPIPRRGDKKVTDPRNDQDYDTFMYGTEPIPGDETWKTRCQLDVGIRPKTKFKGQI